MSNQQIKQQFKPYTPKTHLIFPFIHLIGKTRELPIEIDHQACIKCGKCIRECPLGAIQQSDIVSIDFDKCIHCYHCAIACPQDAIHCPVEKLDAMMQSNIKIIGMEQPGNQYYLSRS
ncbi:MAG: 4Fe-4S binding protein [Anaerolineaceae bacterium]|nr:4Fe-4S binding protein [Anaerolineaceae bacterium]